MNSENPFVPQILASKEFFERSTRVLEEADSEFSPTPDMMTVAQQVAHTAHTIDWFIEGVSRPEGFDLDFAKQAELINAVVSLTKAREMLAAAYDHAIAFVNEKGLEGLMPADSSGTDYGWGADEFGGRGDDRAHGPPSRCIDCVFEAARESADDALRGVGS